MADARWVRMVLIGSHPSGVFSGEIWQTGISMVEEDSGGLSPGAIKAACGVVDAVSDGGVSTEGGWQVDWAWRGTEKFTRANCVSHADAALAFFNSVKGLVPTDSRLDQVRITAFTADGHAVNGANVFQLATPVAGTAASTGQQPAQMCVVASLLTGARGAAGRGRMFLPLNGIAESSGALGTTAKNTTGNSVKSLVEAIRAVGPLAAVVNKTPVTYSDINDVQVGNYFDVQRRRENAITETYTSYTPSIT